jgi:hypothetical protein
VRWRIGISLTLAFAITGGAGAERTIALPPRSITFLDARHGVLGTDQTIETTHDGGVTWTIRYRDKGPFKVVNARGTRRVWATAPRVWLHSGNGGLTWGRLARRPVTGVAFGNPLVGWDVKQNERGTGEIFAWLSETRDGGRTWGRVRRVCKGFSFAGLAHVSERHGWIVCVGQPGAGQQQRAIFETRDRGRTWAMRACGCQAPLTRGRITWSGYPRGMHFIPDGHGVLFQFRGSPILITHDGARTWRHGVGQPEIDLNVDASIVSPRRIYALAAQTAERARLLVTTDGGRNWRLVRRWSATP